jgi:uncharacterized membrane protein
MHVIAQPVHWRLGDFDLPRMVGRAAAGAVGRRDKADRRQDQGEAYIPRSRDDARSVLKAVSWRTLATLDTFAISWFMTGRAAIASSIAGIEIITKIAWYYLHERLWTAVLWGRR